MTVARLSRDAQRVLACLRATRQGIASINRLTRELTLRTGAVQVAVSELGKAGLLELPPTLAGTSLVRLLRGDSETSPPGGDAISPRRGAA